MRIHQKWLTAHPCFAITVEMENDSFCMMLGHYHYFIHLCIPHHQKIQKIIIKIFFYLFEEHLYGYSVVVISYREAAARRKEEDSGGLFIITIHK